MPAILVLVALPSLATIATLLGRHWYAAGDRALISLFVDDVGTSHTPLLGLGSRGRFAHPGPATFWLLAPFRRLFGATGVLTGVAVLNLAAILGTVVVARRRGGLRLAALLGLVLVLVTNTFGAGVLFDPWNPFMSFFPFALVFVLVWSVWCGDHLLLAPSVVVGSLSIQSHVSYAPFVGGLLLGGFIVVGSHLRKGDRTASAALWWSVLAGLLMWTPPLLEQVFGDGNLFHMLSFLRDPPEPAAGWRHAFGVLGIQLQPLGAWITGDEAYPNGLARTGSVLPALAVIGAVVGATIWARRRSALDAARLGIVALFMIAVGVVATSNITGILAPYLFRWWWLIAGLTVAAALNAVVAASRSAALDRAVSALAMTGIAVVVGLLLAQVPPTLPDRPLSTAIGSVAGPTAAALDPDDRYLVRGIDSSSFGAPGPGLLLELERRGFEVFSDRLPGAEFGFGKWRLAAVDEVDGIVSIIAMDDYNAGAREPDGSKLVAEFDPLSRSERQRARELDASIRTYLGDTAPSRQLDLLYGSLYEHVLSTGAPADEVEELRSLQAEGDGLLVFLTPIDTQLGE